MEANMFFIIVLIIVGVLLVYSKNNTRNKSNDTNGQPAEDQTEKDVDFSKAYKWKYLFSLNEKHEFRKLLDWANQNNLYVFPKVRLLDIIEPRRNIDNYKSLFWKIQAKHVDFVVCDEDFKIKFIIELDDNSHDTKKRIH